MSDDRRVVIALDGATDDVVVGASLAGELIHESTIGRGEERFPRHATMLLPEVERAADAAGGWDRVERIGIGVGPGSFTGLRIAIATGRALAQARRLPATAVGTLDALAAGIAARGRDRRAALAVLDARRGEVFAELHDGGGGAPSGPVVLPPARIGEWLSEAVGKGVANGSRPPLAAGSGALRFVRELEVAGVEVLPADDPAHRLSARHLCALAAAGERSGPGAIRPIYLREPDARRWLDRDRG
jgi:tRNA threonylcarbamoyladenosine biosynthesis protein TsaB